MNTVGMALVAGLARRGVEVVFGIPGVHTIELYRGLSGSPIRHVTPRHEQGAGFMADGYARVSGKPGVAFVITGPGLTNTLTAMAQARADSVPILVISGVNRLESHGKGRGHLHELPDQAAMVKSLCPSFTLTTAEALEVVLDAAFAAMTGARPGPVHIEIPLDIMAHPAAEHAAQAPAVAAQTVKPTDLDAAARLLAGAKRPVILVGGGARRASAPLRALAECIDAPVVETVNARGLMPHHPLEVPASPSLPSIRRLLQEADCTLAIGTEFGPTDYDMYQRGPLPRPAKLIHIDICPDQLRRQSADLSLRGDAATLIADLLQRLAPQTTEGAARAAKARAEAMDDLSPEMRDQIALLEVMRDSLPGCVIVGDSTQPVYAGNLYYAHDRAGGWFNAATGYGALGFATGAAVGAAIASPGTPVICLIGDGGLQFSPGELRTAVDEALPIRFIVWNNAGFGEIAQSMRDAQTEVIGCTPSPLKLEPFAAACDLPYQSIPPTPDALRKALAKGPAGPSLIEIRIDP
jgi:acetolactate synthase I/II/III large subunit